MKRYLLVSCLLGTVLLLNACSSFGGIFQQEAEPLHFDSVGLYLGRGSLGQADFEQYKIVSSNVFFECGVVKHGENIALEQMPVTLHAEDQEKISRYLTNLYMILKNHKFKFASPGKGRGMADPGELALNFSLDGKDYQIKTSVDSVTNAKTVEETKLRHVVRAIRHVIGISPCGLNDFYGLGNNVR